MKRCDKSLCPNYKNGTCYQAECNLKEIQEKELNDLAAKLTSDEIMTPNEFRQSIGLKPCSDPETKYIEEDIKAAEKAAETVAAWVKETNRRRNKKRGK